MTARGHATRQENKARRMERILSEARNLIAEEGFDALTISEVAARSEVTIPTVHNLFGKKNDLVLAIFRGLVDNVEAVLSGLSWQIRLLRRKRSLTGLWRSINQTRCFTALRLWGVNGWDCLSTRRAAVCLPNPSLWLKGYAPVPLAEGYLRGHIARTVLAQQLFNAQRLPRQDWVSGYIDLDTYRQQALAGMLLTFAADATPALHERISARLAQLIP